MIVADTHCQKRPFMSERDAKCACRKAGFRLRVYWCEAHRAYHVTNAEKRHHAERSHDHEDGFYVTQSEAE